jgi:hypothetical protein
MTPAKLDELLDAVENFVAALAKLPPAQWSATKVGQLALQHGVAPEQFAGRHTLALE